MDKMEKAFDEAYPKDTREKPAYKTHDALVAEIADLKASFSAMRLNTLMDAIKDLEHQIKVLSERHNDDVDEINALRQQVGGLTSTGRSDGQATGGATIFGVMHYDTKHTGEQG